MGRHPSTHIVRQMHVWLQVRARAADRHKNVVSADPDPKSPDYHARNGFVRASFPLPGLSRSKLASVGDLIGLTRNPTR